MAMFADYHSVVMVMAPAVIAMHFGTRVHSVVIMPDHHFLGTCNRRRRDGDRAKRGYNVSKLLHVILHLNGGSTLRRGERSRRKPRESKEF
jgi:hypothetical protein